MQQCMAAMFRTIIMDLPVTAMLVFVAMSGQQIPGSMIFMAMEFFEIFSFVDVDLLKKMEFIYKH